MPVESRTVAANEAADKWETQFRKGSLELAILACLAAGKFYGLEILRKLSECGLVVPEGTVYPLLSRLKSEGLLDSQWVESEAGHPRKYYRLTPGGRRRAAQMAKFWDEFSGSIESLLAPLRKEER